MVETFLESLFQASTLPLVQTSTLEASNLCHPLMLTSCSTSACSPVWPPPPVDAGSELWAQNWGCVPGGVGVSSPAGGLSRHPKRGGGPSVGGSYHLLHAGQSGMICTTWKPLEAWSREAGVIWSTVTLVLRQKVTCHVGRV